VPEATPVLEVGHVERGWARADEAIGEHLVDARRVVRLEGARALHERDSGAHGARHERPPAARVVRRGGRGPSCSTTSSMPVVNSADSTCDTLQDGCAAITSAAAPAMCGEAMEVPDSTARPLPLCAAAMMSLPGAVRFGFSHPP
jgi:hypothetical protein